ncbi:hypothetical protein NQ318_005826 [Aromia moschata]|uniref:Uncharacterized protein n=1 Tax=Aromia moschata TaxID=1265417 RepID=A0AAV8YTA7_9CUCU|nr:hypothetical protein NQ318_005826 [Aromia moschata]
MLRSIFSLIQNIIDSDREYNNKKSNTVIYLTSTPDNTLNMDLEIDGKPREHLKSVKVKGGDDESCSSFKITTEQGDTVTCKHRTDKKILPKKGSTRDDERLCEEYKRQVQKANERATFSNEEVIGDREVGEDLKNKDQISALMEQIQKMKMGMERLQEIAQQFNTSDQFKKDVELLTKNVASALKTPEVEDKNLQKPS